MKTAIKGERSRAEEPESRVQGQAQRSRRWITLPRRPPVKKETEVVDVEAWVDSKEFTDEYIRKLEATHKEIERACEAKDVENE